MTRPTVDQAVTRSAALGPIGLLLVIAALGLMILGARSTASLIRGLDQTVGSDIAVEQPER